MTLKEQIMELANTVEECENMVRVLKHDPPLTLSFNERQHYLEEFSREGAIALTSYFHLTKGLFCANSSNEQESA